MVGFDEAQRQHFDDEGFCLLEGFASRDLCRRMLDDVVGICRGAGGSGLHQGCLVMPENNLAGDPAPEAEAGVSKVFKLHRRPVFRELLDDPRLLGMLRALLGPELDCFLSQFIFKNPGANLGYVEIVDHDMSRALPVLLQPGDLLLFHSHLMHGSRDNASDHMRAAMVYHCAERGTRDLGEWQNIVNDWVPIGDP
jgi:hypothetical protein